MPLAARHLHCRQLQGLPSLATFGQQQSRCGAPPKATNRPIRGSYGLYGKQLRSPATTPAKERSPATPTREITWQSTGDGGIGRPTPSKATPPRSRSARQRHEAKNEDVVARTTRELGQATGEAARALRTERAAAYASTGAFDAALADLAAALALSKNGARASIHFQRGEVLAKQERSEEAIQAYSACLAENPSHARAAYRRAACRNPLDARAADDYEAALGSGRDARSRGAVAVPPTTAFVALGRRRLRCETRRGRCQGALPRPL